MKLRGAGIALVDAASVNPSSSSSHSRSSEPPPPRLEGGGVAGGVTTGGSAMVVLENASETPPTVSVVMVAVDPNAELLCRTQIAWPLVTVPATLV